MKKAVLNLFFLFISTGCVGVIKDMNALKTLTQDSGDVIIDEYPGIRAVAAISDTKVEVFFDESEYGDDKADITYVVKYGGQQIPKYYSSNSLKKVFKNIDGKREHVYKVSMDGLSPNTQYEFNVEVLNVKTGAQSANNSYMRVKTFANSTARFKGILELKNKPGFLGVSGITVLWEEAEKLGTSISKNIVDPYEYVVTVLDGSTPGFAASPSDINDTSLSESIRKTYTVSEGQRQVEIFGLKEATTYYVQVRAIHEGKRDYWDDQTHKVEENTNYLEIKTYDSKADPVLTNKNSLTSSYPPGVEGLSAINISWINPIGAFDHYRIYYSTDEHAEPAISASCSGVCETISPALTSFKILGLTQKTKYYLSLVVCIDSICTKYLKYTKIAHTTTPIENTAYKGIQSIDAAKSLSQLENMYLNLSLPDFRQGYMGGVDFFACHSTGASDCTISTTSNAQLITTSTTPIYIETGYDYSSSTQLKIGGIDASSTSSYCFLAKGYTYDDNLEKKYIDSAFSLKKCKVPEITAPSFGGFDVNSTCDILKWTTPKTGVFDMFELYYRSKANEQLPKYPLSENDQIYSRVLISADKTSYSLSQLPLNPGSYYDFGIRTLYRGAEGEGSWIRSSNISIEQIKTCQVTN